MLSALSASLVYVITVAGLLGIGWALDANVPARRKRQLNEWVEARLADIRRARWGGANLFDRLFGRRYVSLRAFAVSAGITFTSTALFLLVAILTSEPAVGKMIWPFRGGLDATGWLTISVYLPAILFCDFLSFAQSRLFLSYVSRVQNVSISIVLYFADALFSVLLFAIGYSIARAIVTVVILGSLFAAPFDRDASISPEVVTATYHAFFGGKLFTGPISIDVDQLERALAVYRATPSPAAQRALITSTLHLQYGDLRQLGATVTAADLQCVRELSFAHENRDHLFEILKASDRLILDKAGLSAFSIDFGGRAPFYQSLALADAPKSSCPLYVVHSRIDPDPRRTLINVHWSDYILGSLTLTLTDVVQVLDTKFSSFVGDDPVAQAPLVLTYALMAGKSRPLGIGATAASASANVQFDSFRDGHVLVPLGPMIASSLSANLLFLAYLLFGLSMAASAWLLEGRWTRKVFKREAIFFRISAGLVTVILGASAVIVLTNLVLSLVVRALSSQPFG
jgi:hypothetical protein